MRLIDEDYARRVIIAEQFAKEISWYEIFETIEYYGSYDYFDKNYETIKNKLINSNFKEINSSEFKVLKNIIVNSENYFHSVGYENLAKLFRAIYRENKDFKYLKDKYGGCYIATLVYGSYNKKEVKILRKFRDNVLSKYYIGEVFIEFYYKNSPNLVKRLKNKKRINKFLKLILDVIINILEN